VSRQDELSCISLLETVIQATSTLIVSTYGKRGPISKITSQEGYLFPVGDLIILLTSILGIKVHPIISSNPQARSHGTHGIHIFIILHLVLMWLDGSLVKYLRD
jgi:hypothetical protein